MKPYYLISIVRQQSAYRPLSILRLSPMVANSYNTKMAAKSLSFRWVPAEYYRDFVAGMVFPIAA